ncbi:MAG: universal stress protein [Promicromonosporaceae bacterium]|nr:universal stress protein [Promicromonosporaceae bacterium]
MKVVIWLTEGTWPACVGAARWVPADADVELLFVVDDDIAAAASGAHAGLMGRGTHGDPGGQVAALSAVAADELLASAAQALGRPAARTRRHGRVEHEVVEASAGADLLVCARDGERSRLGPHSLGPATRFVVDHAPCQVLLVWPGPPPGIESMQHPPHPPHHR